MKIFYDKDEAGRYTTWLVRPEKGEVLGQDQLKRLLPYILDQIKKSGNRDLGNVSQSFKAVAASETEGTLNLEGENTSETLAAIQKLCYLHIANKIVVQQFVGEAGEGHAQYINHRVFHFGVEGAKMTVRFFQVTEENTFDLAMDDLSKMYAPVDSKEKVKENKEKEKDLSADLSKLTLSSTEV